MGLATLAARPVLGVAIVAQLLAGITVAATRPTPVAGLQVASGGGTEQADGSEEADDAEPTDGPDGDGASEAGDGEAKVGVPPPTTVVGPGLPPLPAVTTVPPLPPADPAAAPVPRMTVRPRTDRPAYVEGERVVITAEVCNAGTAPATFVVHDGQEVVLNVLDAAGDGVAVGLRQSTGTSRQTWAAGECRPVAPFTWWHEQAVMADEPQHGFPMAPAGAYRVKATFLGQVEGSGPRPPGSEPAGLSDPFELVGVTVAVSTDKPSYAEGEPVVVTARVCNPTSRAHTQTFAWRPEAEIRVQAGGHILAQSGTEGPVQPYGVRFAAGQCRDYAYSWDQRALSDHPEPETRKGERFPPGTYEAPVLWWGHSRADVGTGPDARPGVVATPASFRLA